MHLPSITVPQSMGMLRNKVKKSNNSKMADLTGFTSTFKWDDSGKDKWDGTTETGEPFSKDKVELLIDMNRDRSLLDILSLSLELEQPLNCAVTIKKTYTPDMLSRVESLTP